MVCQLTCRGYGKQLALEDRKLKYMEKWSFVSFEKIYPDGTKVNGQVCPECSSEEGLMFKVCLTCSDWAIANVAKNKIN